MPEPSHEHDRVAREVVHSAYAVHTALGPGLLESVYERCLAHELGLRGLAVATQVALPVAYKGVNMDAGFRIDLLVEQLIVVEVKAVETALPIHQAQLLTYLRLSGFQLGLLINFNVRLLKNGIHRVIATV